MTTADQTEVSCYNPSLLLWLDESGFDKCNDMWKHAYGIHGITPRDHRLLLQGTRFSAIPIISTQGIQDICKTQTMDYGLDCGLDYTAHSARAPLSTVYNKQLINENKEHDANVYLDEY